ncbi:MAG TPA: TlpA disulfide reductase family protein [Steroidobacteraceae bacterium]|nr:TlpA disulfide reductase family protein [Steroidobacteraceae bacterium]
MRVLAALAVLSMALLSLGALGAPTSGEELASSAGRALIGTRAPGFQLKTIDGETIDLGRLYGKQAVYLKFWATWCVPCREQMPHFQHTFEAAGPDLAVIAINTGFNDSIDEIRAYRQKLGITMPIVMDDGTLAGAFGLRVTPQHIVIDRDGRIAYVGHLADARLDAALAAARSEAGAVADEKPPARDAAHRAVAPGARHYRVGDELPKRAPPTIDGRAFTLRDAADPRPTVLVFLSPWCESYLATSRPEASTSCRRMREQVSELEAKAKVRWLGIASGLWATSADLREYRSKYGVKIPLTLDSSGALFRTFDVNQVPVVLLADASGRIVRKIDSADLNTPDVLRGAIDAL